MPAKIKRLSAEKSQQLTRLITITNTANMKAVMDPGELAKVIAVVATDIGKADEMAAAFPQLWGGIAPHADYYSLGVREPLNNSPNERQRGSLAAARAGGVE